LNATSRLNVKKDRTAKSLFTMPQSHEKIRLQFDRLAYQLLIEARNTPAVGPSTKLLELRKLAAQIVAAVRGRQDENRILFNVQKIVLQATMHASASTLDNDNDPKEP